MKSKVPSLAFNYLTEQPQKQATTTNSGLEFTEQESQFGQILADDQDMNLNLQAHE
jgi:hypothetical protein